MAAKSGIPERLIEAYEMAEREPGAVMLGKFARTLGVSCDSLMNLLLEDDPKVEPKPKRRRPPKSQRKQNEG